MYRERERERGSVRGASACLIINFAYNKAVDNGLGFVAYG